MSEVLYIRLDNKETAPVSWLVWSSAEREIIASGQLNNVDELSMLSEKAQHRDVVAVVPSQDVALKSLQVPGNSQRSIKLAAPYMLEEELAEDVEDMFFAYGQVEHSAQHNCHVAVVKRSLIKQWLRWLLQADIECKLMVPEVFALPCHEGALSAMVVNEQLIFRQGPWQGQTIDSSLWVFVAQQWFEHHGTDQEVAIHSYSTLPKLFEQFNVIQEPQELPLALMAQQGLPRFNLLQGEFTIKTKHSTAKSYWLMAAGICFTALLLTVAQKGAKLYQITSEQAKIEQEIISTYKEAFPQTKRVRLSTIKSQLKRQLGQVSQQGKGKDFLTMFAKLQPAFAKVPALTVDSIKFESKRNEIRLNATANDYQAFDAFKNAVERANLEVTQGAQNSQGNQITGAINIKERS